MAKDDDGPRVVRVELKAVIVTLAGGYMSTAVLGGVQFRGNLKQTRREALQDIFLQLTGGNNMDALMALDLAAAGTSSADVQAEIRDALALDTGKALGAGADGHGDSSASYVDEPRARSERTAYGDEAPF